MSRMCFTVSITYIFNIFISVFMKHKCIWNLDSRMALTIY